MHELGFVASRDVFKECHLVRITHDGAYPRGVVPSGMSLGDRLVHIAPLPARAFAMNRSGKRAKETRLSAGRPIPPRMCCLCFVPANVSHVVLHRQPELR